MKNNIKKLAIAAIVMSGLGFAQAEAASVSISANRGGIAVVVSDNKGMNGCNHGQKKVVHNIKDRRHVDRCRMCQDAVRREMARREAARREAARRAAAFKGNRKDIRR